MKIKTEIKGNWNEVLNSARTTINLVEKNKEPSSEWKTKILLSEHSPIRQMFVKAKWSDLPSWVSVHLVRHKISIEHWVRTQRTDRTGINRNDLPQGNLVEHEILASFQSIINISKSRLCNQASKETIQAWQLLLDSIKDKEPELYNVCVPSCIYRGQCFEFKSCGYDSTKKYIENNISYRSQR